MWKRLQSLPPYQGGKRRLLGEIFKHLPRPSEVTTFVDAFLGGGSVSLYAKARGYKVICNDIALRSQIVGESLIANDRVTLVKEDVTRLFVENDNDSFIQEHFGNKVVTTKHAVFLDTAFSNARAVEGVKRWLVLLLLLKYILRQRPMGNFGARTIVGQAERGEWEGMNQHYVRDMLLRGVADHPLKTAETLRKQINSGIFSNGHKNEVHGKDVFTFLGEVEGDVLYLDPPYSGTSAYETSLRALDSMLEGRVVKREPSVFSRTSAAESLNQLFEAAQKFPVWVVSYGNKETSLEELVRLVEKYRSVVHAEEFRYRHLTGLSSDERAEKNRELLVVARRNDEN